MIRFIFCVKRKGMSFHVQNGTPVGVGSLEEFKNLPATQRLIKQCREYKEDWQIREWVDKPKKMHKLVDEGETFSG